MAFAPAAPACQAVDSAKIAVAWRWGVLLLAGCLPPALPPGQPRLVEMDPHIAIAPVGNGSVVGSDVVVSPDGATLLFAASDDDSPYVTDRIAGPRRHHGAGHDLRPHRRGAPSRSGVAAGVRRTAVRSRDHQRNRLALADRSTRRRCAARDLHRSSHRGRRLRGRAPAGRAGRRPAPPGDERECRPRAFGCPGGHHTHHRHAPQLEPGHEAHGVRDGARGRGRVRNRRA